MKYSRLESTEERRNLRNAVIFITLSILVIVVLVIFGIPLVGKVAGFVSGLKSGGNPISINDKTPPAPPRFKVFSDYTNQQNIGISGTAEPGATVKLKFNDKDKDTVADKDGNFSVQNLTLQDGENTFSATAIDNAGNISLESETNTITYDTKPPDLTLTSPADGTAFFGSTQRQINIQGSTDSSAGVTINDRIVSIDENGNFQYPVTLNSGVNTFNIKSTDRAGNLTEKNITLNFSE